MITWRIILLGLFFIDIILNAHAAGVAYEKPVTRNRNYFIGGTIADILIFLIIYLYWGS